MGEKSESSNSFAAGSQLTVSNGFVLCAIVYMQIKKWNPFLI